ncbi:MAG: ComEC/Rec2 family competence protein, partial [Alphaproteobacteria bacterium]|nr:ComEC/Rec2 family competence protein [Alphaproteobacteria bacterium]
MFSIGCIAYFELSYVLPDYVAEVALAVAISTPITIILAYRIPQFFTHSVLVSFTLLFLFMIGVLAGGYQWTKFDAESLNSHEMLQEPYSGRIDGLLVEVESHGSRDRLIIQDPVFRKRYLGEAVGFLLKGRIRVSIAKSMYRDLVLPGDYVTLKAKLTIPENQIFPETYNQSFRFWYSGISGSGYAISYLEKTTEEPDVEVGIFTKISMLGEQMRVKLGKHIVGLESFLTDEDDDIRELRRALLTGERKGISDKVNAILRAAGIAHVLAISGLHMGLAGFFTYSLVRRVFALFPTFSSDNETHKIAACIAILVISMYLAISGQAISAQRAYVMTAIVFVAVLVDRRALTLNTLAVALWIVLIISPESILSPGLHLSFAAVGALIACYESQPIMRLSVYFRANLVRRILGYCILLSLSSFIAGAATMPFTLYHFGQFSPYGILGNLLALPIMGVVVM